jgi:hypothetical protein
LPELINIIIGLAIALVAAGLVVLFRVLRLGPETRDDSFWPLPATRPSRSS